MTWQWCSKLHSSHFFLLFRFIFHHQYLMLFISSPEFLSYPLLIAILAASVGQLWIALIYFLIDLWWVLILFWGNVGLFSWCWVHVQEPSCIPNTNLPKVLWRTFTDLIHCNHPVGLVWSFPLHEDLLFIRSVLQGLLGHWSRHCRDTNQPKVSMKLVNAFKGSH